MSSNILKLQLAQSKKRVRELENQVSEHLKEIKRLRNTENTFEISKLELEVKILNNKIDKLEEENKLLNDKLTIITRDNERIINENSIILKELNNTKELIILGEIMFNYKLLKGKKLYPNKKNYIIQDMQNYLIFDDEELHIYQRLTKMRNDAMHGQDLFVESTNQRDIFLKYSNIFLKTEEIDNIDKYNKIFEDILKTI